jgi:hypothetical protein
MYECIMKFYSEVVKNELLLGTLSKEAPNRVSGKGVQNEQKIVKKMRCLFNAMSGKQSE